MDATGSAGAQAALGRGANPLDPAPRTWLFTPADQPRKLDASRRSRAGVVIADLEDAVAPQRKLLAREHAFEFVSRGGAPPGAGDPPDAGGPPDAGAPPGDGSPPAGHAPLRVARINDPRTDVGRADLERLSAAAPPALMVPKAELDSLALAHAADVRTIALVETARGVAEVERIAVLDGVVAVALGTVDLAAELGLGELPDGLELLHVRSRLVLACALGGVPALDGVHLAIEDRDALAAEARRARALGFAGKLCIHPAQIDVVRAAFAPSAAELERARAVVDAYRQSLAEQRGAALAGGEMVDLATVRRAEALLRELRE
jgi:citrate lyase subunit beta/citryl-CoA lyase